MTDARAAAVVGGSVGRSLSPRLHRAAYADLGLTGWTYDAVDVPAWTLADVAARVRRDGLGGLPVAGLSVTMPLKQEAAELATRAEEVVGQVGAANTLVPEGDEGWAAYNTDVDGILGALAENGVVVATNPVVLGGGGAALGAMAALRRLGAHGVRLVRRDPARSEAAIRAAEQLHLSVMSLPWSSAHEALEQADVVIATVPAGASAALGPVRWPHGVTVLDAAYGGEGSALLAGVAAAGGTPVAGEVMLLHQAVRQVELMTGRRPWVDAMRAALWEKPGDQPAPG